MRCIAGIAMCVAVVLTLAAVASPGWADDTAYDEFRVLRAPPPPPPPAIETEAARFTWADNGDELPMPPEPPAPPAPEMIEEAPPVEYVEPMPQPPTMVAPPPMPMPMPGPCEAPRVYTRDTLASDMRAAASSCCIPRDECGWALDWNGCRYGRVEFHAEGLVSFFEAPEGEFGVPATPLADVMTWDPLDYDLEFGGRGTLRYAVAPEEWLEIRGTYYGSFENSVREAGQFGFLPGPGGVGGASAPNAATLTTESEIFSGEFNYWSEIACMGYTSWSLGVGFRWVQFNELARADNWATPFAPFTVPPFAESDVDNQFLGLQIGTSARYEFSSCFDILFSVKGMVGNLNREIEITDRSFFAGGTHTATSEENVIALGADVDVMLRYRFSPRIAVTAGYNMLILDDVIRAHDAMDFTKSTSGAIQPIHDTDQMIIHSFLLGLHLNF